MNMLHEICSRMIYNDERLSFNKLFNKDSSVSIRIRNIQRLAIEMFKFYKEFSPPIIDNVLKLKTETPCNLRQESGFSRPVLKTFYHGTESI